MKNVILSADSDIKLYAVPDAVASNLRSFCLEFDHWLHHAPAAKRYRMHGGVCFDEDDFILWLNTVRCPEEPSSFIKVIGCYGSKIPVEYKDIPRFNF